MQEKSLDKHHISKQQSKDYGEFHKWLSEHKVLRHLAIHLLIALLWGAIYYLQKKDKEKI